MLSVIAAHAAASERGISDLPELLVCASRSGCDRLGVLPVFGPGVCVKVCVVLRMGLGGGSEAETPTTTGTRL